MSASNFLFGAPHASIRARELRGQLGDFQDRDPLACLHMVADIDVNHLDVAGQLGMNVDILKTV